MPDLITTPELKATKDVILEEAIAIIDRSRADFDYTLAKSLKQKVGHSELTNMMNHKLDHNEINYFRQDFSKKHDSFQRQTIK